MAKASGFTGAVSKFKKNWDNAKKQKVDSLKDTDLPEGRYFIRVSKARCGVSKKTKVPYVSIEFRVVRGPHTGAKLSKLSMLEEEKIDNALEYLGKDFQRMGYEVENLKLEEIEELVADLDKSKPYIDGQIKHDTYESKKTKKTETVQRLWLNGVVEASELPPGDDGDEDGAGKKKGGKPKGGAPAKKKAAAKK